MEAILNCPECGKNTYSSLDGRKHVKVGDNVRCNFCNAVFEIGGMEMRFTGK